MQRHESARGRDILSGQLRRGAAEFQTGVLAGGRSFGWSEWDPNKKGFVNLYDPKREGKLLPEGKHQALLRPATWSFPQPSVSEVRLFLCRQFQVLRDGSTNVIHL